MISMSSVLVPSVCALSFIPLLGQAVERAAEGVVAELAEEIRNNYVFPEIGQRTADYLLKRDTEGAYDGLDDQQLALTITQDLQSFTSDRHFAVRMLPSGWQEQSQDNSEELADPRPNTSPNGFMRVERLDGNIGYLDLDGFMQVDAARANTHAAMQLLAGSSALIFDLRDNGGGDPETVQLISSYLFDPQEPVHLNSLYFRPTDETTEFWTHDEIEVANAMPDIPVYVLTSGYTFSAAEEFSYNLKCLKRGTIVGETTGGGAHPVDGFVVDDRFVANIPVGRAINPITQTNWEGTGVQPDIEIESERALDRAMIEILETLAETGDDSARWGLINLRSRLSPLELSASELAEYAGQYTDRELKMEGDSLMYRRKGRPSWSSLIAVDEDQFVIDGFDGFLMTFERNSDGEITQIVGSYVQGHSDRSDRE
jgi:retinol-binding protein 3